MGDARLSVKLKTEPEEVVFRFGSRRGSRAKLSWSSERRNCPFHLRVSRVLPQRSGRAVAESSFTGALPMLRIGRGGVSTLYLHCLYRTVAPVHSASRRAPIQYVRFSVHNAFQAIRISV